ncbi:MAG: choice-of-anchor R domain-containing protein [Polyangiaceae bacterium]
MTERARWRAKWPLALFAALLVQNCFPEVDPLRTEQPTPSDASADEGDGQTPADSPSEDAPTCPPSLPKGVTPYELFELGGEPITVDGDCSDPAWDRAALVQFSGAASSPFVPRWRMLWSAATGKVYGCVEVTDTTPHATSVVDDDSSSEAGVFSDDRIQFFLHGSESATLSKETVSVAVNPCGTRWDARYDKGYADKSYDPISQLDTQHPPLTGWCSDAGTSKDAGAADAGADSGDGGAAVGYVIEWETAVPFSPAPGLVGRCDFAKFDRTTATTETAVVAFGSKMPDVPNFGYCVFSCDSEPGAAIGNVNTGTSTDTLQNQIVFSKYKAPVNLTLSKMHINLELGSTFPGDKLRMAIYADQGGYPGDILGWTEEGSALDTVGWNALSLTAKLTLNAGKSYWLAAWANNKQYVVRADKINFDGSTQFIDLVYASAFPSPMPAGASTFDKKYDLYAK